MNRLIAPLCRGLLKMGLTPNLVTAIGALGSAISAGYFFPRGEFFWGMWATLFFVLSDLVDGTMARLSGGGTKWGAFLDSTLDRITDGAILISIAIYLHRTNQFRLLVVALVALVAGNLVSYVKARAEAMGAECKGGFAERSERLIILFIGLGFAGLHVKYALAFSIWLLAIASIFTVLQRLQIVYRQLR